MNRRKKTIPSNLLLLFLLILCVMVLFTSYVSGFSGGVFKSVSNYVFVPMQKGLDFVGSSVSESRENAVTISDLKAQNAMLTQQVEDLTTQLNNTQLEQSELEGLRELYNLDQQYSDYEKTGARVIARGGSNWFNTFTIDKGSDDGIKVNMNVIAGSGLAGIVTETGKSYSIVRAVIDDTSNISGMSLNTGNLCIVSGDIKTMTNENRINLTNLEDPDNQITEGEPIVTSNISDKYLPGILIGYVTTLSENAHNLTQSGTLTPDGDFKHLQNVLVIMQVKEGSTK